jgi:hypothetical protein
MDRSASGVSGAVAVALSLPGLGSVVPLGGATVAVLLREPVRPGLTARVRVKLALPLGASRPVV